MKRKPKIIHSKQFLCRSPYTGEVTIPVMEVVTVFKCPFYGHLAEHRWANFMIVNRFFHKPIRQVTMGDGRSDLSGADIVMRSKPIEQRRMPISSKCGWISNRELEVYFLRIR